MRAPSERAARGRRAARRRLAGAPEPAVGLAAALAASVVAAALLEPPAEEEWPEVRITRPEPAAGEPEDGGAGLEIDAARVAEADKALASRLEEQPEVLAPLVDAARAADVEPPLVLALAWHESRWRPDAVSVAGAMGVMQVMPGTAERVASEVERIEPPVDLLDPEENAAVGAAYIGRMLDRYDGDARRALQAYNQGPVTLEASGPVPSAAAFADRVLETAGLLADAGEPVPG